MTVELTLNMYIYSRYILIYGRNDKISGIGFKIFFCRMGSKCRSSTTKLVSKIRFNIDNHWSDMEGFPGGSVVKNLPANAGVTGSIPVSGRSPRDGNGNPLQYSCLENPMARGAWRATVHGVTKEPDMTDQLNNSHELRGGHMGGY